MGNYWHRFPPSTPPPPLPLPACLPADRAARLPHPAGFVQIMSGLPSLGMEPRFAELQFQLQPSFAYRGGRAQANCSSRDSLSLSMLAIIARVSVIVIAPAISPIRSRNTADMQNDPMRGSRMRGTQRSGSDKSLPLPGNCDPLPIAWLWATKWARFGRFASATD